MYKKSAAAIAMMIAALVCAPEASWATTESTTVNVGSLSSSYGYSVGSFGSASPTNLSGGQAYRQILTYGNAHGFQSVFNLSGFSSDPGSSWLNSVTCAHGASTVQSYSYSGGTASWSVSGVLFNSADVGNNISCTVDHN